MARHNKTRRTQQHRKSNERVGEAFAVFRPVEAEAAEGIFSLLRMMQTDGIIPVQAKLRRPEDMRVTLIERNRMTKLLQGFAAGFNAHVVVDEINGTLDSANQVITVTPGRMKAMDRRGHSVSTVLLHDQTLAKEYTAISNALAYVNVPRERRQFRPHITLLQAAEMDAAQRTDVAKHVMEVLPEEIPLDPLRLDPPNPGQRRPR